MSITTVLPEDFLITGCTSQPPVVLRIEPWTQAHFTRWGYDPRSAYSERFHLPLVGPILRDYRAGLGMPLKAKWLASVSLSLAVSTSAVFAIRMPWAKAGCVMLGLIGLWYIWSRVPLREKVLAEREHSDSDQA